MASEPEMDRPAPRWGHLAFLTVAAAFAAWYASDAFMASATLQNLILIVPGAVLCIGLAVFLVLREVRAQPAPQETPAEEASADEVAEADEAGPAARDERIPPLMLAMLGIYVAAMVWLGFDIATFLFVAASLRLLGKRNWLVIVGYSALFTFVVIAGMGQLVSLPDMYLLGWALP